MKLGIFGRGARALPLGAKVGEEATFLKVGRWHVRVWDYRPVLLRTRFTLKTTSTHFESLHDIDKALNAA